MRDLGFKGFWFWDDSSRQAQKGRWAVASTLDHTQDLLRV